MQEAKTREFLQLQELLGVIMDIHKVEFAPVHPVVVPPPPAPDEKAIRKRRMEEQVAGISVFRRSLRKEARARASALAAEDLDAARKNLEKEHRKAQAQAEEAWTRLKANDPSTVIATVDQAFEDNEAPAAPVNVEGSTLSLVMLAPSVNQIPDRMPDITAAGNPTTKKMTKSIRADTYLTLICGHLLATIKESLSVAPGITDVKAVVVREATPDVYGQTRREALLAASYARSDLTRVRWEQATSPEIVQQAAGDLFWNLRGRPPELKPLDLDDQPDLKIFLEAIDERIQQADS